MNESRKSTRDILEDMRERQVRMESAQNGFIENTKMKREWCKEEMGRILKTQDEHNCRIRSVEKRVWWATGATSVASFVASLLLGHHK